MSETIQVALITLFGVVVGSILTFIPAWLQGNREKIKFQKEIFESRFSAIEKHLKEYLQRLEPLYESCIPSDVMTLDLDILYSCQIANDYFINQAADQVSTTYVQLLRESDFVEEGSHDIGDLQTLSFELKESCSKLIVEIDRFRLNDYKPRKKPLNKRISELVKKKKKEQ